jgi:hypothetical protein
MVAQNLAELTSSSAQTGPVLIERRWADNGHHSKVDTELFGSTASQSSSGEVTV